MATSCGALTAILIRAGQFSGLQCSGHILDSVHGWLILEVSASSLGPLYHFIRVVAQCPSPPYTWPMATATCDLNNKSFENINSVVMKPINSIRRRQSPQQIVDRSEWAGGEKNNTTYQFSAHLFCLDC